MSWIQQLQTVNWHHGLSVSLGAYLLGCFTLGYYLVRWRTGEDIREIGSGSVGAKNVGRYFGKSGFILTALGDIGKGALAVLVTRHFTPDQKLAALAMLAVTAGHIWPVQLLFRGGKGIATLLGALSVYDYHQALIFVVVFLCAFVIFRKTVLPGLFGVACLPLADIYFERDPACAVIVSISAALVLFMHRKNIVEECVHLAMRRHFHTHSDQS